MAVDPNLLDRVISWWAPQAGLRRLQARAVGRIIQDQYDSARPRRAADGWITPSTSANAEIGPALIRTRDNARDLCRNNPYGRRVPEVWTAHLVGDGIVAQAKTDDDALNGVLQGAWKSWAETSECDADGQLDFYGQQSLATSSMVESGESLLRLRSRYLDDALTVPLQIQVLEGDYLDHTKIAMLPNGGAILMGVQFSPLGDREGYWLYRNHPGDNVFAYQRSSNFVPADQIIHLYRKSRPGQVRGITWLHAIINDLYDVRDLDKKIDMKAAVEACLAVFVTSANSATNLGAPSSTVQENGTTRRFDTMEPAMINYLKPGETISSVEPSSGGNYDAQRKARLGGAGIGSGITYDQITGDLTGANYSSLNAGKIEFRRGLSQLQWHTLIPVMCQPVWDRFSLMGSAAGLWRNPINAVEWMPPRNEPIDKQKDTDAELADIGAGLASYSQTVRKRGYDPKALAEEIAGDDKMLTDLGLARFIVGPRTAAASNTQATPVPAPDPNA